MKDIFESADWVREAEAKKAKPAEPDVILNVEVTSTLTPSVRPWMTVTLADDLIWGVAPVEPPKHG